MSLRNAIKEELAADGGVSAIVADRIYELTAAADATEPYLIIEITDEEGQPHLRGGSGLVDATVGIECVATTATGMDALADAVREALDTKRDTLGTGADATVVRNIALTARGDTVIEPRDGSRGYKRVRRLVFTVWYRESIPA